MDKTAQQAGWTPEFSLTVKGVGAARVSPDGTRAAFTVTDPVMTEDRSEFVVQIWLAATDGSGAYQATFGEKSSDNPRWSPDGRFLAFTSKRGEKSRLYVMRLEGGESEPITDDKADAGDFRWSPDSARIAVLITDAPAEDDEKRKKSRDDWSWKEEDVKYSRLHVVSVAKDEEGAREPRLLTTADRHVGLFDWSPDGRRIVFDHTEGPLGDLWTSSKISVVDVATAAVTPLVEGPGAANRPLYSPDGESIAFVRTKNPPRWYFQADICVMPAAGGEPRALAPTYDEIPIPIGWSADSSAVLFQEAYHTTTRLYSARLAGGIDVLYTGGVNADFSLNADRTWVMSLYQDPLGGTHCVFGISAIIV